jgi:hypothetical protein
VATYGKAALDTLRSEITTVRHIGESNQDRRIIMILNFHAQKCWTNFLGSATLPSIQTVSLEEIGYLEELLRKTAQVQDSALCQAEKPV